ncbi:signal transduction histidine kinase [Catenuloplanes nepalensis]|uniref:Signal transduction histidine kinase n=1 Tax=Catenuloplanes nepalensis TaxID=587533 RepID=A0ABT9MNA3_9ACTN|nr:ATP-binding protein [Catenuloplanes nepalensis]MDP9792868.1 signal transduction histidine kinase [Catenuloplanes nepalensis]
MPGAVEQRLLDQGLRYALGLRVVVIGLSSSVSLALAAMPDRAVAAVVVTAFNVWSLLYAFAMVRGGARARQWLPVADVAAVCGICLSMSWTVTPDPRGGATWVLIALNMVVVTYPWQIGGRALAAATATIIAVYYTGATIADPGGWLADATLGPWTAAEAALSFGLYRFVRRSARTSDRIIERGAELRRAAEIAAARRSGEREYLAALHDTAAATLLMVGNGVVARPEPWLSAQARRDLAELHRSGDAAHGETDLLPLLREAARHTTLRLAWTVPESLTLPAADAVSLSRGVREALTNVARHAGTDTAEIRVRDDGTQVTVEIIDAGRGFDPARIAADRYGVTRSLIERMTRTGGRARIDSSPGHGTTVTLTCPRTAEDDGGDREVITASFQRGLRWAAISITLAILTLLDLPRLLASGAAYTALWPQLVTWTGLIAVTLVVAAATWRDRPLGRWRWPLVALVFALSALATSAVRPEWLLGSAHWSEGDAGWPIVLLLMGGRVPVLVAVLAGQYLMTFGQAALAGDAALSVAGAISATWAVLSYQLAIAMIAAVLRGMAVSSARAVRAAERLRTSEAVAEHLHTDRTGRIAALATTAVPLLEGLASQVLDPGDASVRRACAAEAARMRRLIAGDDAHADALAHELRAAVEQAERAGVTVTFAEQGTRPDLPPQVRRRLVEPAIAALATATGRARLTITSAGETVTVSVVAACAPPPPAPDGDGVRRSVLADGDRLWIQAAWQGEQ